MTRVVLRLARRALRRLDVMLDSSERYTANRLPPPDNGYGEDLARFLDSLDTTAAGAAAYFDEHRERLIRTLSLVPLGSSSARVLELGSYLQMAAALDRVLKYGTVRAAYYSASPGVHARSLPIKGQSPFTVEVDLFDAELHPYPYAESSFDVVLCCELIEHLVHDPMHMLLECRRILADSGQLVLTTPNAASLTSVAAVLDGRHNPQVFSRYPPKGNDDIPHVHEYTPTEISQALEAAGFEVTVLATERMKGAEHATWALDVLGANGFDTSLRGEQIYCIARKKTPASVNRYPGFLYAG
jgi:SAM-dependent methyltransferase